MGAAHAGMAEAAEHAGAAEAAERVVAERVVDAGMEARTAEVAKRLKERVACAGAVETALSATLERVAET